MARTIINPIKTVDAGTRDPDARIEGISASKMRELAMRGDEKNFIRMTPPSYKTSKKPMMRYVRVWVYRRSP